MADIDKLNIDSIIQRLLEGKIWEILKAKSVLYGDLKHTMWGFLNHKYSRG